MAPGPEVAKQTPVSPVNLAWAQAIKAAISSCIDWVKRVVHLNGEKKLQIEGLYL